MLEAIATALTRVFAQHTEKCVLMMSDRGDEGRKTAFLDQTVVQYPIPDHWIQIQHAKY